LLVSFGAVSLLIGRCVLQVDLGRLTFLTVVGTQGRYARYSGNEFSRAYRLNYSRDGLLWRSWRNRLGNTVRGGAMEYMMVSSEY